MAHPFLDAESSEIRLNFIHESIATNGICCVIRKTPAKIRLNKELHEIMYPLNSDWAGLHYNISQGDYIKSLVEDYARKTIFDRESIYYKSIIRDFETFVNTENENKQRRS